MKLQPEGFKRKILTAIGSKLVQYQYIDLNIRKNYFTMNPILKKVRFLHSEEQEVNLGWGNSPSLIKELEKHLKLINPNLAININKSINEEIHLLISSEFIRKLPKQMWWRQKGNIKTNNPTLKHDWLETYVGPKLLIFKSQINNNNHIFVGSISQNWKVKFLTNIKRKNSQCY